MNRREFFKSSAVATAGVTLGASSLNAQEVTTSDKELKAIAPSSLEAEFSIKNGNLIPNTNQRMAFSRCFGCFDTCGVRVRIDNKTNKVLKVCGNPYSADTQGKPMSLETPVKEAFTKLTALEEQGLSHRATVCGRGNAVLDAIDDPHRVTKCLKRVGKRGEKKWESIPYEQLIKEVTAGGDLFGEGNVEGLKDIRDLHTPANKKYSDFGPKANQLLVSGLSEQEARWHFMQRFAHSVWGTVNIGCKDAYCGHQQVAGCGMGCFDGTGEMALPSIDYDNCEFAMYIGTNPGLSGISLNAVGRRLADAKSRNNFKYVVVDPILRSITNEASKNKGEWIPIKSGTDTALMFAMLNYIINNELYFKDYLAQPSQDAANNIKQKNFTNATYLVVKEKNHPLYNKFLRADVIGVGTNEEMVVVNEKTGKFVNSSSAKPAKLYFDGFVKDINDKKIKVVSALSLLKNRVNEHTINTYSKYCGVPIEKIVEISKEFTSHGQKVGIETNTGCNSTDGSIFAFAATMLNTMVGAHNAKGGLHHMGSMGFASMYDTNMEPLYNLMAFDHAKTSGFPAERSGNYEESNEYKQKVASGKNPYPANQAWTTTYTQENTGEALIAHANGNPFNFKAWISWSTNPLYNCSGLKDQVLDSITDTKKLPLFIAIDPFINETNIYADYIIPDTVQYEEWSCARMWGSEYIADVACVPIIEPKTVRNDNNQHVCMEQFLIDISKELNLSGLGKKAFKDAKGKAYDINTPSDYYVRLFANVAHTGEVLPSPTEEDILYSSVYRVMPLLNNKLKADEVGPTAYMLTRGGRFEDFGERYEGEFLTEAIRMDTQFQIYNEGLASTKDSYHGAYFDGQPIFEMDKFWDGTSVRSLWSSDEYPYSFSTFKSQLRSPYSVVLPRVVALSPTNYIQMNEDDALMQNLKTGDKARVVSPKGKHIEGIIQADNTIAKGSIAIPTGYGHSAFGVDDTVIDGKVKEGIKSRAGGMAVNEFNVVDPTREGASLYRDRIFGCTARHGVPVKIEKV